MPELLITTFRPTVLFPDFMRPLADVFFCRFHWAPSELEHGPLSRLEDERERTVPIAFAHDLQNQLGR